MKYLLNSWLFLVLCSGYLVYGPNSYFQNCFKSYNPASKEMYDVFCINYDGTGFQIAIVGEKIQDQDKTKLEQVIEYSGYDQFGKDGEVQPIDPTKRTILRNNEVFVHFVLPVTSKDLENLDVFSLIPVENDQTLLELAKDLFQRIYTVCDTAKTRQNWQEILEEHFPDSTYTKYTPDYINPPRNSLLTYIIEQKGHILFMRDENRKVEYCANLPYICAQGFNMDNVGKVSMDYEGEMYAFKPQNCIDQLPKIDPQEIVNLCIDQLPKIDPQEIVNLLNTAKSRNPKTDINVLDMLETYMLETLAQNPDVVANLKLLYIRISEEMLSNMFGIPFQYVQETGKVDEFPIQINDKIAKINDPKGTLEFTAPIQSSDQCISNGLPETLAQNPDVVAKLMESDNKRTKKDNDKLQANLQRIGFYLSPNPSIQASVNVPLRLFERLFEKWPEPGQPAAEDLKFHILMYLQLPSYYDVYGMDNASLKVVPVVYVYFDIVKQTLHTLHKTGDIELKISWVDPHNITLEFSLNEESFEFLMPTINSEPNYYTIEKLLQRESQKQCNNFVKPTRYVLQPSILQFQ